MERIPGNDWQEPVREVPPDATSCALALMAFFLPLIGAIVYFASRKSVPLMARSVGRGTVWGFAFLIFVVVPVVYPAYKQIGEAEDYKRIAGSMRQLNLGTLQYCQDYDGKLPDLSSPASLRAGIMPYVKSELLFVCPISGEPYRGNAMLSGKLLEKIKNPERVILLYEADADYHGGRRGVVFVDGRYRTLDEAQWAKAQRESGIW